MFFLVIIFLVTSVYFNKCFHWFIKQKKYLKIKIEIIFIYFSSTLYIEPCLLLLFHDFQSIVPANTSAMALKWYADRIWMENTSWMKFSNLLFCYSISGTYIYYTRFQNKTRNQSIFFYIWLEASQSLNCKDYFCEFLWIEKKNTCETNKFPKLIQVF